MATEHGEWREQAGLYVLGALDASERAAFEAHLASCASCAAEVRSLLPIAAALAHAAPQTDPPAALRARVLGFIGDPNVGLEPDATAVARGTDVRVRQGPTDASALTRVPWLAAAASLALAIGLGMYAAQLKGRIGNLESRLREAIARADGADRQVADARHALSEAESEVAVLGAPDLARIDLAGQKVAPQATGRAYWSRSRGLVFRAANLPALPPGRTYQLWILTPGAPVGAALLKPDADGRVSVVFGTPTDLPKVVGMAVTIEPDGGVPAPTGDMYLVGHAL